VVLGHRDTATISLPPLGTKFLMEGKEGSECGRSGFDLI
jgi:hypothetical protein